MPLEFLIMEPQFCCISKSPVRRILHSTTNTVLDKPCQKKPNILDYFSSLLVVLALRVQSLSVEEHVCSLIVCYSNFFFFGAQVCQFFSVHNSVHNQYCLSVVHVMCMLLF